MNQILIAPAAIFAIALVWLAFSRIKVKQPGPINAGEVSHSWLVEHRTDGQSIDR